MKTTIENPNMPHNGRTMAGIIILIIGGILLIDQFDVFFIPHWLFSWPMWIIAYGVYMGGKYNFRKPIWVWMVVIGTAFLFTENINNAENFVWPLAIIGTGVWLVMRHDKKIAPPYTNTQYKEV